MVTGNFCTLLAYIFSKLSFPKRPNELPSKSTVWRRVASEFLGQTLAPLPAPMPAPPLQGNDVEWQDLYNVLEDYILRGVPILSNEIYLLFTYLQAAGWALLYLYWKPALRGHWSVIVVATTVIVSSAGMPFLANYFYWKYDRLTAWDFTARLINEIKIRKSSVPSPQGN